MSHKQCSRNIRGVGSCTKGDEPSFSTTVGHKGEYEEELNVCVQSQTGHALAQGQRNQGQPEFTSSP